MNLGGSGYGDVDYYGGIAAFRIGGGPHRRSHPSWSDVAALDGLLDHPEIDHFVGALNMAGANGEATDQGALDGWLHGDAARRPLVRARRFGPVALDVRPALVLVGGDEPTSTFTEAVFAQAVAVAPVSVTEWGVDGNDVGWTDLHYGWPVGTSTAVLDAQGDTLAFHPVLGEATMYNNETLHYFGVPYEVVDRYELSRYITPYGINLTLDSDGWAWVFDVTDYAPLLRDSVELECGNWQELLDLKFAFIEGTPPRM